MVRTQTEKPTIHAAQQRVAKRMRDAMESENICILIAPPGSGKTRIIRETMDLADEKVGTKYILTVYVTISAAQARAQGKEVGSHYACPFQFKYAHSLSKELEKGPTRITMTHDMFKKLVLDPSDKLKNEFLNPLLGEGGSVRFVLDEVHQLYKCPKVAKAIAATRGSATQEIHVSGLTATLEFDPEEEDMRYERVKTMFGGIPKLVEYEKKEIESFKADTIKQPAIPSSPLSIWL